MLKIIPLFYMEIEDLLLRQNGFGKLNVKAEKFKKLKDNIVYNYLSGSSKNIDLVFHKYKDKNILAYANVEDNNIIIK